MHFKPEHNLLALESAHRDLVWEHYQVPFKVLYFEVQSLQLIYEILT